MKKKKKHWIISSATGTFTKVTSTGASISPLGFEYLQYLDCIYNCTYNSL